jgi:hypothetical protein
LYSCSHCNSKINKGINFCPSCGKKVVYSELTENKIDKVLYKATETVSAINQEVSESDVVNTSKTKTLTGVVIVPVALFFVAITSYYIFQDVETINHKARRMEETGGKYYNGDNTGYLWDNIGNSSIFLIIALIVLVMWLLWKPKK